MGGSVLLQPPRLQVEPGREAGLEAVVRNLGNVVDQFTISVVGDTADWAEVNPPTLSLFPNAEDRVRITFRPPRSSQSRAGEVPFGVRVSSQEDPKGSVVEEGVIDVGTFFDVGAELIPQASQGRKRGRHEVAVDNRGNARLPVSLDAFDDDDFLDFDLDPPRLDTAPGTAAFSKLRVKARKGYWRGPVRTHPFQLVASSDGQVEPNAVVGTFLQKPRLPRWLPRAIMALLALGILAALAWFFLLKPTVQTAVKDAVEDEFAIQNAKNAAQDSQDAAQQEAINKLAEAANISVPTPPPTPAATDAEVAATSTDGRIEVTATAGTTRTGFFPVPSGRRLSVTDIVFQNPDGDAAQVTVLRGTAELMKLRAENFRDLDYHFVTPLVFNAGERLVLRIQCTSSSDGQCRIGIYYSGFFQAT